MKIAVYEAKDYESSVFDCAKDYNLELIKTSDSINEENISLAKGCEGVTVLGKSILDATRIKTLAAGGVKYLATRTIGFNHIDVKAAKECGMRVANAKYDPFNVADFTVMLLLMLLRKAKISVCRALVNDFSLDGMGGREVRSLTVGIVGMGKIGAAVAKNLSGFGCKIVCYDPYVKSVPAGATLLSLDELLKRSDVVTLHMPLTQENYHMFDRSAFDKMKSGALLINTARGALVDTVALVNAVESGKLGGAALDTIEGEDNIYHVDLRTGIVAQRDLFYLKQFPNVIYTPHYAFFTEEATCSMARCALESFAAFREKKPCPNEI